MNEKVVKFSVHMPEVYVKALDAKALSLGLNRNQLIRQITREALHLPPPHIHIGRGPSRRVKARAKKASV